MPSDAARLALEAAGEGVWDWDVASGQVRFSEGWCRLAGYEPGEVREDVEAWRGLIHPDDLPDVLALRDEHLIGRTPRYESEHRVRCRDGRWAWMLERGGVVSRDAAGRTLRMVGTCIDVSARKLGESILVERTRQLELGLRAGGLELWSWDLATDRVSHSTRVSSLFGPRPSPGTSRASAFFDALHPDDRARVRAAIDDALQGRAEYDVECRVMQPDGSLRWMADRGDVIRDAAGAPVAMVGVARDVTERVRLEEQLRQAQKMEAVGQLAGGVAHDFNNLLTVIGGNLSFVRADLPPDHAVQADLAEIGRASDRARALVRQLLAFSRKQVLSPRALDLNEVVRGAEKLLRRVIGEEIVLETALGRDVGIVLADAGQLDQVLLNLAVNARDAMLTAQHGHPGTGGTLTLETGTTTLHGRDVAAWAPLAPGRHVRLTVRDTGHGMDQATRAHVFEPFFTTKPVGAGTGLGLATVYGIVAQSGGAVRLDSAPGQGTTITILLPEVEAMPGDGEAGAAAHPASGQHGLVLLVEDEAAVRSTARRILERNGYAVLEARHGADALLLWRAHRDEVTAVVTDLRMPEMGGRELATVLREDRPEVPLVLVTGYADQPLVTQLGPSTAHVEKPFTGDALLAALRQVVAGER